MSGVPPAVEKISYAKAAAQNGRGTAVRGRPVTLTTRSTAPRTRTVSSTTTSPEEWPKHGTPSTSCTVPAITGNGATAAKPASSAESNSSNPDNGKIVDSSMSTPSARSWASLFSKQNVKPKEVPKAISSAPAHQKSMKDENSGKSTPMVETDPVPMTNAPPEPTATSATSDAKRALDPVFPVGVSKDESGVAQTKDDSTPSPVNCDLDKAQDAKEVVQASEVDPRLCATPPVSSTSTVEPSPVPVPIAELETDVAAEFKCDEGKVKDLTQPMYVTTSSHEAPVDIQMPTTAPGSSNQVEGYVPAAVQQPVQIVNQQTMYSAANYPYPVYYQKFQYQNQVPYVANGIPQQGYYTNVYYAGYSPQQLNALQMQSVAQQQYEQYMALMQQQQQYRANMVAAGYGYNQQPQPNQFRQQQFGNVAPTTQVQYQCQAVHNQRSGGSGAHIDNWNNAVASMDRENRIREKIGLMINNRYTVMNKISMGSYGSIYSASDIFCPNRLVAVKFETYKNETDESHIGHEYEVYKRVSTVDTEDRNARKTPGFPQVYWIGVEFNYRIMIMELLGPSLDNLFNFCNHNFAPETIYKLATQMLDRVQFLHKNGFVHRDLKPDNFLIGIHELEDRVFMIDFGLTRRLRTNQVPEAELCRKSKHLVGTAKYASLNSHNGMELSRRDDLESLGYILLEFMKGELPWKVDENKPRRAQCKQDTYRRMQRGKEECDFKRICPPLAEWMDYVKNLGFYDEPDYDRLRGYLHTYVMESPVNHHLEESMSHLSLSGRGRNRNRNRRDRDSRRQVQAVSNNNGQGSSSQGSGGTLNGTEKTLEDRLKSSKFDWVYRRESSDSERYRYDCLYGWTLPYGAEPVRPQNHVPSLLFG